LDTAFFVLSKLAGVVIKVESWLLICAMISFWAGLNHNMRLQKWTCVTLVLAFLALGLIPLGDILLRPIEARFPVVKDVGMVDGIIVLGGGEDVPASRQSMQPELGEGGDRYMAAVELARRYPGARLLFTGGSGDLRHISDTDITEAEIARQVFEGFGIGSQRIIFENRSRNTAENARLSYVLVAPEANERWILITSAFHMPRAVNSFEAAGWRGIIPYPVDFRTWAWSDGLGWNFQRNLALVNIALSEWVGRAAYVVARR
jgi:uncharacterized SAM-binding protein YcdF (DUF218 family)